MRVLATLTLTLAAAAVVARSADVRAFEGEIQINKITYTDDAATEVCIGGGTTFPKNEMIELWVTTKTMENRAEVSMLTNYKTENTADGDSCILFEAKSPPKNKIVEYVVAYMRAGEEEKDGVSFTYIEVPEEYYFECDGVSFKRTGAGSGGYVVADPPAQDPGCITPDRKDFMYCQPSKVHIFGDNDYEVPNPVDSLWYTGTGSTGKFVLTTKVKGDVVIVIDEKDDSAEVVAVTDSTEVLLSTFTRSASTYATCVVQEDPTRRPGGNTNGITVSEASEITDLDVQGKYSKQGGQSPQDGKGYYEFGFQNMDAASKKFHAKSGQKKVTINCEQIDVSERCYGYLQQEDDAKTLTISYAADDTNTITVDKDSIAKPSP